MTDQDRGAYTPPTDAPLSFDARQPVRGSRPAPLTLIVSGLVLAVLVVAIVVFYRSGVREANQPPAVVGEPVGPMTAQAPPDAQPDNPAANLQIYKSEDPGAAPAAPTFTAPPEEPKVRQAPSSVQTAQLPAAAGPSTAAAGLKPAQPLAPETKPAPPPAPKPAPVVVAKAAPPPAPKPAPAVVAKAAPPPAAKVAAPPAAAGTSVQIGAFSSQAQADSGYAAAGRIAGVDIAGKSKRVETVQVNGSTLYRTSVVGFGSRGQAQAFCGQLKAAGKNCFVK